MNAEFLLYWSLISVSLFNTIILFWLGWTVFLNAEKKTGGIWLATVGLLVGGVFFATHTAMLDYTIDALILGVRSWWYGFFAPIVLLPYAWYLLMLWYAGFWDDFQSDLHRRHARGLIWTTFLVIALIALLFFANPFRLSDESTLVRDLLRMSARVFPFAALLYPLFIVSCLGLALDALHRPSRSGRMMGDLARRRARPWLLAASLVQFAVSLLVGAALGWLILALKFGPIGSIVADSSQFIDGLDFLLTALISLTIILMGKAVVSYEIFTGKTLPRRGFLRQWRGVVTLSLFFSIAISWCIGMELRPIYALLIVVFLMSFSFALLSWRFFREREMAMEQLRPFVASQHFYERVLDSPHHNGRADAEKTFRALCENVLEARGAKLIPLGAITPFAGAPLCYPDENHAPEAPESFPDDADFPHILENQSGGNWAIPLRDAKGEHRLNGVLLLAEKRNDGLYNEEEIEVARAAAERLLDTLAGASLASRLMELQRRRLSEAQLLDGRSTLSLRRALHDDILPRLHAAMLLMNSGNAAGDETSRDETARVEAQTQLAEAHREISGLLRAMPSALASSVAQAGVLGALRPTVEKEFGDDFDEVSWRIAPEAAERVAALSPLVAETLFHAAREAIRNAARHGRGETPNGDGTPRPPLRLTLAATTHNGLELVISDDGVGVTGEYSANGDGGHGLALHSTMMAVVGGTLAVENNAPRGTRVRLHLPAPRE